MKKILALVLSLVLVCSALAGCSKDDTNDSTPAASGESQDNGGAESNTPSADPVKLNVVTTYAGNDGNAQNFRDMVAAWEAKTGNYVSDGSQTSSEEFKARVSADFAVGAEPDVLFFFYGSDADSFLDKVVSIDEIRAEYPEYASNMDFTKINPSSDGNYYVVPSNGYWEGMFVNKAILAEYGLEVPGADTTWDEFMEMCKTIADGGKYTPIAASLGLEIHYWFEFCVYNYTTPATHATVPTNMEEAAPMVSGMEDIKAMYEAKCFPENTFTMTGAEAKQLFIDGQAAFYVDGSWATGGIADGVANLDDFTVTYVPGKNDRKSTDIISGLSSGYFITKKAWDDPAKRAAAVDFVEYMTTTEATAKFAGIAVTALAEEVEPADDYNSLQIAALDMIAGSTGNAPALQDGITNTARAPLFDNFSEVATGAKTAEAAVQEVLDNIAAEAAAAE